MIEQVGGEGIATIGDLTNVEDNRRCVEEAADAFGGLDVVVDSAALDGGGGSPAGVKLESWDAVMDLNLRAAFLVGRHSIPHLRAAGGGSIVNISSVAASLGHGSGAYAASKAGLEGLTRDWAFVHGHEHIHREQYRDRAYLHADGQPRGKAVPRTASPSRAPRDRRQHVGRRVARGVPGI